MSKMSVTSEFTKIARENGFSLNAALAAQRIAQHVDAGGWLGANWPHYACGIKDDAGRVVRSGFDCFTEKEIEEGNEIAHIYDPQISEIAECNFEVEARGELK